MKFLVQILKTNEKTNVNTTGPREISIGDPAAIQLVHGLKTTVKKGPFYAALTDSVHTTDDPVFHKERRKVWDAAFKECAYCYSEVRDQN